MSHESYHRAEEREYERMKAKQDRTGKYGRLHWPYIEPDEDDQDDEVGSK